MVLWQFAVHSTVQSDLKDNLKKINDISGFFFFNVSNFSFQKTNHLSVPWSSNREPALLETGQICVTDLTMLCVLLWTWLRLPKTILQHFNAIDNIDWSHLEGLLILIHWIQLQHIQIHSLNFQRLSSALLSRVNQ